MDILNLVREACKRMEIPLFGIADAGRWDDPGYGIFVPEPFRPRSIFPKTNSVITIALPVHLPVLETSPSIWYHELYETVNGLLDQYTYRIAELLNLNGYPSVYIPRDGYGGLKALQKNPVAFFSHRHAAVLSGLGSFGVNNIVLTKEWGPRVRFGSVFTAANIPADPVMEEELCTRCNLCVRICPVGALDEEPYPDGLTDKKACTSVSASLRERYISPCGQCIKVCPVGEDRRRYGREDATIYLDPERAGDVKAGWEHVRSYGGI